MTTLAVVAIQSGSWPELAGPWGTVLSIVMTLWILVHLLGGVSIFARRASLRRQQAYLARIRHG